MSSAVSPLAPARFPDMPPIAGVRLATAAAGIRYAGRTDVLLTLLDPGTAVAGVLTRSKCPSAPVDWCRTRLKAGKARALVVNSGNANAFTGKSGRDAVGVAQVEEHSLRHFAHHLPGLEIHDEERLLSLELGGVRTLLFDAGHKLDSDFKFPSKNLINNRLLNLFNSQEGRAVIVSSSSDEVSTQRNAGGASSPMLQSASLPFKSGRNKILY